MLRSRFPAKVGQSNALSHSGMPGGVENSARSKRLLGARSRRWQRTQIEASTLDIDPPKGVV
jgi:hypothetical protein